MFINRNQLASIREVVKHINSNLRNISIWMYFEHSSVYFDAYKVILISIEYHMFLHGVTSHINQSKSKSHYHILELLIYKI